MMKNVILFLPMVLLINVCGCEKSDDCDQPEACLEKPKAGPCEALFIKYYFDENSKKCKEFEWGGCDGNVPFDTLEECWECECSKRLE